MVIWLCWARRVNRSKRVARLANFGRQRASLELQRLRLYLAHSKVPLIRVCVYDWLKWAPNGALKVRLKIMFCILHGEKILKCRHIILFSRFKKKKTFESPCRECPYILCINTLTRKFKTRCKFIANTYIMCNKSKTFLKSNTLIFWSINIKRQTSFRFLYFQVVK